MHSRKTRPKLPILDGIMDAVSNGLRIGFRFLKSNSDFFDFRRGDCRKIGAISDNRVVAIFQI